MYPVPVDPLEMATVRTVIGHSSEGSRQSLDGIFPASISPPRAGTSLRKSVSEIGHGSVIYAPLSPEASVSSLEHLPHFPTQSEDPSREFIPREFAPPQVEKIPPPVPPKRPFSFKRALSFKRVAEHKSTSDIPSALDSFPLPSHRPSRSVDLGSQILTIPTVAVDENGRKRLRRRSTVANDPRDGSASPSIRRSRDRPLFMLSPDASESSLLSTNATATHSTSPVNSMAPSAMATRRRLTKRRPSQRSRSNLPTTVEVDTPKLETADPLATLSTPLPSFLPHSEQAPALPTPGTPGLPLSAPPTTGLRIPDIHSVNLDTRYQRHTPSTILMQSIPPVPPLPTQTQLPTPSASSSSDEAKSSYMTTKATTAIPPSAMRALRPSMPHRPSLERRASRRRWTLDIASEDIDENILKEELERLRLLGKPSGNPEANHTDPDWTLARKVLLSSREVILTERSYLNQITRFMADSASDPGTPPMLVKHLPLLISASQAFCNRLVEDPSAWGVSAAFITVEAVLEQVLVDYCQVVGQIILACQQQAATQKSPSSSHSRFPSLSKSRTSIANGANEFGKNFIPSSKSAEKVAGDDREKHPPVSAWNNGFDENAIGATGRGFPRTRSMPGKSSKGRRVSLPANASSTSIGTMTAPPTPNHAGGSSTHLATTPGPSPTDKRPIGNLATGKAKAITAADIAIAPPQRVTRYVMLYRDLLNGTPLTAPSRPLVQRALDGALRIAENCNRAQNFMNRKP
ncbi:hypothetical protein M408DRAFT_240315 [Serendipita vermifera MAFF 305830]|uniref:DH domain-containing protein n=1 Tax=Serendipita vermifera MAFF 305830 TaxID=933852 RepID=A0A0C2XSG4_SERVB|nr:hypothetical protein M408DRAFT_240315 [Serendipita vermifera MAFF 305830]